MSDAKPVKFVCTCGLVLWRGTGKAPFHAIGCPACKRTFTAKTPAAATSRQQTMNEFQKQS